MAAKRISTVLVFSCALLWGAPGVAFAQTEATLSGAVADSSNAILPGVTVTATEVTSGRQYVSVTDARGEYRLPSMLPGAYRVQAELSGFTTVIVPRVELLVGQDAALPMTLKVAAVQETVTVTGEAPLLNTRTVEVGGNIDRLQMEELPIQGRNWMELSMLVKGVTANDVSANRPVGREGLFQMNLDGQQITQEVSGSGGFGQPQMSRSAIAEYQVVTNMYDVTMGRSAGVQIQAISRSGTNQMAGDAYGYFRDDSLNAADFVAGEVLPYSNQQAGFSLGGPIRTDKLHYFGTYEYQREPQTILARPQVLNGQELALPTKTTQNLLLGRVDYQISARDHLVVRGNYSNFKNPFTAVGGNSYPAGGTDQWRYSAAVTGNWSRVISNNAVQEVKGGYSHYYWKYDLAQGVPQVPTYRFPNFVVADKFFYPEYFFQRMPSARYDLTWHRGGHDLRIGGEYLNRFDGGWWPVNGRGQLVFTELPDDIDRRFPIAAWNDASRWDLSGLDPTALQYTQNFARDFNINIPRKTTGLWVNDTWAMNDRFTLSAGLRWDIDWGALDPPGPQGGQFEDQTVLINNGFDPPNFDAGYKTGVRDYTNFSPRVGLTYRVDDTLVLRGGAGLFYAFPVSNLTFGVQLNNGQNVVATLFTNDGQPGFVQDPTRGITADDVLDGTVALPPRSLATIPTSYRDSRLLQANVGFQKQVGDVFGFDADVTYTNGDRLGLQRDVNLFYDPATGYPKNPGVFGRPLPQYGGITWYESNLDSDSLALATSFTKRFRDRWQAQTTYTLMFFENDEGTTGLGYIGSVNNPFCIECEWGRSNTFQRHTLRFNGVYQAPWDISLAGIYAFGSGNYYVTSFAANPFGVSGGLFGLNRFVTKAFEVPTAVRDRFDGPTSFQVGDTLPKNALQGEALSKFDLRVTKGIRIPGSSMELEGIFEVFNLFNHENHGSYNGAFVATSDATLARFGQPVQNLSLAYLPRVVQLAFRVAF